MASERRRYSRVGEAVCTWLSFHRDGAAYGTLTMDLGPCGAQFRANKRICVNERVSVHIQLPSGAIGCEGTVCWVQRAEDGASHFGVLFMDLPDCDRDHLHRYIGKAAA